MKLHEVKLFAFRKPRRLGLAIKGRSEKTNREKKVVGRYTCGAE